MPTDSSRDSWCASTWAATAGRVTARSRGRSFNQGEFADRHEEALALLATWVRSGTLKYKEQIVVGLETAPAAFLGMLEGANFGKLLVQVSDDPTR